MARRKGKAKGARRLTVQPEAWLIQRFEATAHAPDAWVFSAYLLKLAADLLGDRILDQAKQFAVEKIDADFTYVPSLPVYLLLAGYTIEALSKALFLKVKKLPGDEELSAELGNHSAATCLGRAGFTLSEEERDLLRLLETAVKWAGRYPAPKFPEDMSIGVVTASPDVIARCRALSKRIEAQII